MDCSDGLFEYILLNMLTILLKKLINIYGLDSWGIDNFHKPIHNIILFTISCQTCKFINNCKIFPNDTIK